MKSYPRYLVPILITVFLFALAAVLPIAFLNSEPPQDGHTDNAEAEIPYASVETETNDRTGLWTAWWENDGHATSTTYAYVPAAKYDALLVCTSQLEALLSRFIFDTAEREYQSYGDEYLRLRDENGAGMDVWHTYMEWTGDWHNWVDVYFDVGTGKPLYFYVSTRCVKNQEHYAETVSGKLDCRAAAAIWAEIDGAENSLLDWSGKDGETAMLKVSADGDLTSYCLRCTDNTVDLSSDRNFFDLKIYVSEGE